ncbi:glycosyl hydrolase [Glaciibacter superstes]|uniref:glycosyl hydrolase n=1 Tax=Glaciibacter superstes TaxID=501023 RepID=UPI0003B3577F|nr:glycosyl hydrolase [Glaciibacter superstes]
MLDRPRVRLEPLDPGRFAEPEADDRPGIRWWWQSPVATEELVRQLNAIADAGFREVEIAFSRGFWGDEAQRTALTAVLLEAERLGVGVAMTLGASWPLSTPNTTAGTPFSTRELQYGSVRLPADRTESVHLPAAFDDPAQFDDPAPVNDAADRLSTLVRVTAARVVERNAPASVVTIADPASPRRRVIEPPAASTVLNGASLIDLTSQVVGSAIRWEPREGDWVLFAFWMRDCEQGVTNFLDRDAALAATAYLDEHQIGADNLELLRAAGTELFEDSLELNADSLYWTSDLLERFIERHGYDPTPYLPLLFAHGMCRYWVPNEEPVPDFELDTGDVFDAGVGARVRRDYYRLLTDLYISDHLLVLQDWAASHGLRHKSQAAYGQNLEAVRSNRAFVRAGGRAEGESLNSGDRVPLTRTDATWRFALDWQRSVVGGAHQGGAVRISTELGAQFRAAYAVTLGDLQQMLAKEWAAGITKPFVHGVASQSPEADWPTQTRFQQIVSDSWNDTHFPEWANWRPLTDYWARGTVVLETGVPRTDIAVYRDGFLTSAARGVRDATADATAPARLADTEALELAGFSVQFIDPGGVVEGVVEGGAAGSSVFADGPAYRGLVIDERMLPPETAEALASAAERGVRLVVVGEPPSADSGFAHGRAGDERVCAAMARALALPSVTRVETLAEASVAFTRLGLVPRVTVDGQSLLTQWREAGSCRYLLVYNTLSQPVSARLSLEGAGRVRELDLWSGRIDSVPHAAEGERTTVEALVPALGVRVFELDVGVEPETVADARVVDAPTVADAAVELEGWRLHVVSEEPGGPREIELDGVGPGDWRGIAALRGVSGVGRYSARVVLPDERLAGRAAKIDLGGLAGSAVVRVGGRVFGTAYVSNTVIDLGTSAVNEAEIEIEVRTSLRNAVIESGIDVFDEVPSRPHGLIGPVRILVERNSHRHPSLISHERQST